MSKSTLIKALFLVFLSSLLVFSLLASSCNIGKNDTSSDISALLNTYENKIIILENELSHLKNDYVILDSEKTAEIDKLRGEIQSLKSELNSGSGNNNNNPGSSDNDTQKKSDFTYEIKNGKATITGYTGTDTAIVIPSSVDGYTVTEIADNAFKSLRISSVSIPSTVTSIGWFAFTDCISLTAAVIPESVVSIGYEAFSGCKSLTIYAASGSYASKYAKSYGITVSGE